MTVIVSSGHGLEASSESGDTTLSNVRGRVVASAVSGDINSAGMVFISETTLSSSSGNPDISLAQGLTSNAGFYSLSGANLMIHTLNRGPGRKVVLQSASGTVRLK